MARDLLGIDERPGRTERHLQLIWRAICPRKVDHALGRHHVRAQPAQFEGTA